MYSQRLGMQIHQLPSCMTDGGIIRGRARASLRIIELVRGVITSTLWAFHSVTRYRIIPARPNALCSPALFACTGYKCLFQANYEWSAQAPRAFQPSNRYL
jgi:hypothetical protein